MSKNRIIQSALSLISKKEIWNVSASEIASQAETSKANVFYHFNSLENLYSRMFDDFQAEIKDEIWNELNDNWNTERKLEHLFMKRGRWALNNSEKMRFLIMWYSINGLLSKSIEDKNLWRIIS
ncbi:MAG: TetR/AcrR family transcriptional regulator, partial [Crocinitomicaceae bacterium]